MTTLDARQQARLELNEPHVIEQITRIAQDRKVTASGVKVYISLINLVRNGYEETKREHIAELTGLHDRTITRAITVLKDAGYIKATQIHHGSKYVILK